MKSFEDPKLPIENAVFDAIALKDDEIKSLRYDLLHVTAERDQLLQEVKRLKEHINNLYKSHSRL